jgi:excisionase family DNA binding protein
VAKREIERRYLSVDELETLTGISKWTWRRWAYSGRIASCKLGTRLLVPATELDRVAAAGTRPAVARVS